MSIQESADKYCGVGDTVETTLSTGDVIRLKLETPEAAAYANDLIVARRWRKVDEDLSLGTD